MFVGETLCSEEAVSSWQGTWILHLACIYKKKMRCLLHLHPHRYSHTYTGVYVSSFLQFFFFFTFSLFSSVRVKCERVSRSGCPLPVSLSEVCVCNIYFIGISLSPCWVAAGHVMFWAVKGHHCHSWKMRCGCKRETHETWTRQKQRQNHVCHVCLGVGIARVLGAQWKWQRQVEAFGFMQFAGGKVRFKAECIISVHGCLWSSSHSARWFLLRTQCEK